MENSHGNISGNMETIDCYPDRAHSNHAANLSSAATHVRTNVVEFFKSLYGAEASKAEKENKAEPALPQPPPAGGTGKGKAEPAKEEKESKAKPVRIRVPQFGQLLGSIIGEALLRFVSTGHAETPSPLAAVRAR